MIPLSTDIIVHYSTHTHAWVGVATPTLPQGRQSMIEKQ